MVASFGRHLVVFLVLGHALVDAMNVVMPRHEDSDDDNAMRIALRNQKGKPASLEDTPNEMIWTSSLGGRPLNEIHGKMPHGVKQGLDYTSTSNEDDLKSAQVLRQKQLEEIHARRDWEEKADTDRKRHSKVETQIPAGTKKQFPGSSRIPAPPPNLPKFDKSGSAIPGSYSHTNAPLHHEYDTHGHHQPHHAGAGISQKVEQPGSNKGTSHMQTGHESWAQGHSAPVVHGIQYPVEANHHHHHHHYHHDDTSDNSKHGHHVHDSSHGHGHHEHHSTPPAPGLAAAPGETEKDGLHVLAQVEHVSKAAKTAAKEGHHISVYAKEEPLPLGNPASTVVPSEHEEALGAQQLAQLEAVIENPTISLPSSSKARPSHGHRSSMSHERAIGAQILVAEEGGNDIEQPEDAPSGPVMIPKEEPGRDQPPADEPAAHTDELIRRKSAPSSNPVVPKGEPEQNRAHKDETAEEKNRPVEHKDEPAQPKDDFAAAAAVVPKDVPVQDVAHKDGAATATVTVIPKEPKDMEGHHKEEGSVVHYESEGSPGHTDEPAAHKDAPAAVAQPAAATVRPSTHGPETADKMRPAAVKESTPTKSESGSGSVSKPSAAVPANPITPPPAAPRHDGLGDSVGAQVLVSAEASKAARPLPKKQHSINSLQRKAFRKAKSTERRAEAAYSKLAEQLQTLKAEVQQLKNSANPSSYVQKPKGHEASAPAKPSLDAARPDKVLVVTDALAKPSDNSSPSSLVKTVPRQRHAWTSGHVVKKEAATAPPTQEAPAAARQAPVAAMQAAPAAPVNQEHQALLDVSGAETVDTSSTDSWPAHIQDGQPAIQRSILLGPPTIKGQEGKPTVHTQSHVNRPAATLKVGHHSRPLKPKRIHYGGGQAVVGDGSLGAGRWAHLPATNHRFGWGGGVESAVNKDAVQKLQPAGQSTDVPAILSGLDADKRDVAKLLLQKLDKENAQKLLTDILRSTPSNSQQEQQAFTAHPRSQEVQATPHHHLSATSSGQEVRAPAEEASRDSNAESMIRVGPGRHHQVGPGRHQHAVVPMRHHWKKQ